VTREFLSLAPLLFFQIPFEGFSLEFHKCHQHMLRFVKEKN
jgi:hypothetical protein